MLDYIGELLYSDAILCTAPLFIILGAFIVGIFGTIWNKIDENRRKERWRRKSNSYWRNDGRRKDW